MVGADFFVGRFHGCDNLKTRSESSGEGDERRAAAEQMAQRAEADRREAEMTSRRANELDPDVDVEEDEQART